VAQVVSVTLIGYFSELRLARVLVTVKKLELSGHDIVSRFQVLLQYCIMMCVTKAPGLFPIIHIFLSFESNHLISDHKNARAICLSLH
jgi:hypothetical protein